MTQEEFNAQLLQILASDVSNDLKQQQIVNIASQLSRGILLGLVNDLRDGWATWPVDERDQNITAFLDTYQR